MCPIGGWSRNGGPTRMGWCGPIAGCGTIACWPRPASRSRSACLNESAEKALFRRDHHQHLATLHARELLDLGALGGVVLNPLEHGHAELAMGELATAESQRHLHLVAL